MCALSRPAPLPPNPQQLPPQSRPAVHSALAEHLLALIGYLLLSVGLTWPLVRDFDRLLIGTGFADPKHSMWLLWHLKETALGRQPLFDTSWLYFPNGISLLTDGVGPVAAAFSLPFWLWGAVAAYNGAILISVALSGYCGYLLAREIGLARLAAVFSGVLVAVAPIHLAGVYEHLEKTFIGFLALALLVTLRALDQRRGRGWLLAPAVLLLLTAMYSGYQFIYASLGVGLVMLYHLWVAPEGERREAWWRVLVSGALIILVCSPYLYAITQATANPLLGNRYKVNISAGMFAPDLVQYFIPSFYHAVLAPLFFSIDAGARNPHAAFLPGLLHSKYWVGISTETAVTLPWSGLALSALALWQRRRQAALWLLLFLVFFVFSLGPYLRLWGETTFTDFQLPVVLPFAFLASLPGLDFMRVSSRFMMLGSIALAMLAGIGLQWLAQRRLARHYLPLGMALLALLLLESWPRPWLQASLPETPAFYQQLAGDGEQYGVLDLPAGFGPTDNPGGWPELASTYQMYQMGHGKKIAWGYLSHVYEQHPLPVLAWLTTYDDAQERGLQPGRSQALAAYADGVRQLSHAGFRYVVYHKQLFSGQAATAESRASAFLAVAFADQTPFYEDEQVRVYRLESALIGR